MIDVKEMTLSSFLSHIKEETANDDKAVLYSFTKEITSVGLLNVYDWFKQTNRYYWSNHEESFALVGIGLVREIKSLEHHVHHLSTDWKTLVSDIMEHNPYQYPGTGMTAIGGMAFDPTAKKGEVWRNFPTAKLSIPTFMITFTEERYFLTVNGEMDDTTSIQETLDSVHAFENDLYNMKNRTHINAQKIKRQEEVNPEQWKQSVQNAIDTIKLGHANKIVLAREMKITLNKAANVATLLQQLRQTQPNSYVFAYESGEDCFVGASPERLVFVEGDQVYSSCLAGTTPRGRTTAEDKILADELLHDPKNLEEHAYVVHMIKNSIASFCTDITIPDDPVIYPLKNLQHLYTPVKATLKKEYDVLDMLEYLHPTPALGGVPRDKALAFIREQEEMDRGWYGAPIGWIDCAGNSEFAVAIRSGLVQKNEMRLFAGCGVMRDSDPEMEYEETKVKFLPMLHVLED